MVFQWRQWNKKEESGRNKGTEVECDVDMSFRALLLSMGCWCWVSLMRSCLHTTIIVMARTTRVRTQTIIVTTETIQVILKIAWKGAYA